MIKSKQPAGGTPICLSVCLRSASPGWAQAGGLRVAGGSTCPQAFTSLLSSPGWLEAFWRSSCPAGLQQVIPVPQLLAAVPSLLPLPRSREGRGVAAGPARSQPRLLLSWIRETLPPRLLMEAVNLLRWLPGTPRSPHPELCTGWMQSTRTPLRFALRLWLCQVTFLPRAVAPCSPCPSAVLEPGSRDEQRCEDAAACSSSGVFSRIVKGT